MNQQAKTKRSFPYVGLILWVTVVLVVAILGYTLVDSIGLIGRLDNAAKSDNFKINENHVDVYRYHVAQNELYYQYMYIQYGMMTDPTGGYVKNGLMDAATFINYMIPNYVGTDSFDASAYAYAEQYITYCEGAKEAGLYDQYKAEVAADVEAYIEGLKTTAESNGITFGSYLKQWIGAGVTKGEIETAMEYYYIGGKYAEKLFNDFSDAVTVEEITKYRDENKGSFYKTTYTSYKLVNKDLKDKYGLNDNCTSIDAAKTAIVNYYMDQKFEAQYKTNFTDKKVEDTAGLEQTKADVKTTLLSLAGVKDQKAVFTDKKDGTDYEKAAYAVVKAINASASAEVNKIKEGSANWADPTAKDASDLNKWLFADGRKEGDSKLIETKSTSKDKNGKETTTYTYTWYIVEKDVMKLDEEYTKNAYYIQLSDDAKDVKDGKTAAQKAEAFYNALKDNKTAENFAELVTKYAPGYAAELNERISFETIKSSNEDLAKWLYEEGRAKGDITNIIVKGDTKDENKITGHIIAMFESTNEKTTWELNATDAVANEKLTAWFDEAVEKYHVVIDYEPETTAATTAKPEESKEPTAATTAKPEETKEPTTEAATTSEN